MSRRETLQLLALLASFVVAGYAAVRLLAGKPIGVGVWFVGSAVVHDLVLFPLYAGLDAALVLLLRGHPRLATIGGVPWLNHLRVPAVVCGLLLLVWSPLILRLPTAFHASSGLSEQPFLSHWLAVTLALFGISATTLLARVATNTRRAGSPSETRSVNRLPAAASTSCTTPQDHSGQQRPTADDPPNEITSG
jgi:hypothetical protein